MKIRIVPELFATLSFKVVPVERPVGSLDFRRRLDSFAAAEWLAVSRSGPALRLLARYAGHVTPESLEDWLASDEAFEICVVGTAKSKTVHGWKLPKRQLSRNSCRPPRRLRTDKSDVPFAGDLSPEAKPPST
jgi:hypothetical protein